MFLKYQILKNLTAHGKKSIGEKILLRLLKNLYKVTRHDAKKIICLILLNSMPVFYINDHTSIKKKKWKHKTPLIIKSFETRISISMKIVLSILKSKKSEYLYLKWCREITFGNTLKRWALELKNDLQKQALMKKHLFFYYKWK